MIATEKTKVLVDVGLSAKQILLRLAAVGVDSDDLDGILITHEHSDHAAGLRVLLSSINCPVYVSGKTRDAYLRDRKTQNNEAQKRSDALKNRDVEIESDRDFQIGDIDFESFSVPHDAADNFGFVAKNRGIRIATLMDFGCFTPLINEKLLDCDGIVVESNHSRDMLMACSVYSWELKQRIASRTGHLSNEDLAAWLANDFDGSARDIVLSHLSQRANEPNLAKLMAQSALDSRDPLFKAETNLTISYEKTPTNWIEY